MAALVRASFRSEHPIFNIKMDALRPGADCVLTYGRTIYDFGLEFNGIYFYVDPQEAADAFILTGDEVTWRVVLYRRSLYHSVNRNIPVEFDLAVIQESNSPRKEEQKEAVVEPIVSTTVESILTQIDSKLREVFGPVTRIRDIDEEKEEIPPSSKDSSSEEDSEEEEEVAPLRENVILLQKLYQLAKENMGEEELQTLNEYAQIDERIHDTLKTYEEYDEEITRLSELDEDIGLYPKVASYYFFMVHIFKDHTNRALKWFLIYLTNRFRIKKSVLQQYVLLDSIEPEEYTIETEEGTKSIFQQITFSVLGQERLRIGEDSDFSESEETSEEIKNLKESIISNFEAAVEHVKETSERHLEDISKMRIAEIDAILPRRERPQELRLLNYSFRVVELVRGIG